MLVDIAKMFRPLNDLRFMQKTRDNKNHVIVFFGENTNFFDAFDKLNLNTKVFRTFFVPTTEPPIRTYMDVNIRNKILQKGLRPIRGRFNNVDVISNRNFIIDSTIFFDELVSRLNISRFLHKRYMRFFDIYFDGVSNIDDNKFSKYLYYCIDLRKPLNRSILRRRFYPFFSKLIRLTKNSDEKFLFDKLFLVLINQDGSVQYRLLYDKNERVNFPRIRSILLNIKSVNKENSEDVDLEDELPDDLFEFDQEEIDIVKQLKKDLD